jgi:C4-dicarboxylate-binding protein DctP
MANFVKYCGGVPLLISASKQNQALADGTVEMAMTGISGVQARELWRAADTITRTEHAAIELIVIINEKVWQSLAENHRTIIFEASRKVERDLRDKMARIEAEAYAFARDKGMKIYELSAEEVAEWRACSARVIEDYMSGTGELGWRLMDAYGKLRTDPCCNFPSQGPFMLR